MRHYDPRRYGGRRAQVLDKIQDEFARAGHHDGAGAERPATDTLGYAGTDMLDADLLAVGPASFARTAGWVRRFAHSR